MNIISHRGYWKNASEKNQGIAFERSFELGYGTETDLRDLDGEIMISHDMPLSQQAIMSFEELLQLHKSINSELPLLLNIKADGLQAPVKALIERYELKHYYLFDMSVPDLIVSLRHDLHCLSRQSEYEIEPSLYSETDGVWMDEFKHQWIDEHYLSNHAKEGKKIFIVSPELHGRPHLERWEYFKRIKPEVRSQCVLCTDLPEDASLFFSS